MASSAQPAGQVELAAEPAPAKGQEPLAGPATASRSPASEPANNELSGTSADTPEAPAPSPPETPPAEPPQLEPKQALPRALAEAPGAVWYVRPASGGQYGPAPSEAFMQWLIENRVTADSLVWRDGWPEWLLAGQVFEDYFQREMPTGDAPAAAPSATRFPQDSATEQPATGPATPSLSLSEKNRAARKLRRKRNYMLMIAALSVLALVLLVVLIVVLLMQR